MQTLLPLRHSELTGSHVGCTPQGKKGGPGQLHILWVFAVWLCSAQPLGSEQHFCMSDFEKKLVELIFTVDVH